MILIVLKIELYIIYNHYTKLKKVYEG